MEEDLSHKFSKCVVALHVITTCTSHNRLVSNHAVAISR